jgi:type IV secretory pathway VirB10-like protein
MEEDLTPFLATTVPPTPSERLKAPIIYTVVGAAAACILFAIFLGVQSFLAPPAPPPGLPQQDLPAMTAQPLPFPPGLPVTTSFAGVDRRPKDPPPPIPRAEPVAEAAPPPPVPKEVPGPPQKAPAPPPSPPAKPAAPPPPPKPLPRWFQSEALQPSKPVFPVLAPTKGQGDVQAKKAAGLLQEATWVRPADITGVLYRGMPIHAILLKNINSDIPGDITFYVDRDVTDAYGQGRVLIPQHSFGVGKQAGGLKPGDTRLPAGVEQIRLADGSVLTFKGQLADKSGAVGLTGSVDNHYPALALKVLLSTALSIGSRLPSGNTTGYQQTLPQEFAQDAAHGINQAGQKLVEQQLQIAPTFRAKAGYVITLEVQENVNMAHEATEVK